MSDYPQTIEYHGETLQLLRVTEQPEVMGCPKRIEYGYKMGSPELVIYMRWDFGQGVDWDLTWENPGTNPSKGDVIETEKALAELFPTEKLKHELPMRPRLQATPPEARGALDLSAYIRTFQQGATKGNKSK